MKNRTKKGLFLFVICVLCTAFGQAQRITVSGSVKGNEGAPVPGANIVEKGTTNGVSTDFDGNYQIEVASDAVLVISYIGFETAEVAVNGRSAVDVLLNESTSELDEVVVVAYGTQKKETVTSSVVEVKADKLADITVPEVGSMLQGKVTGVQVLPGSGSPGASPNILIRGRSSINSTNSPLWVIDGVIVGNSDPKLNPNDVESISVLKDASATALYGNRGANGVVLITTKRGKIGSKPKMQVSIKTAVNRFNPGKFEVMNAQQLYNYHLELGNTNPWFQEGLRDRDFDWLGAATQTGLVRDASVTFTAAEENHNLFLSTGYYNEEGTVRGNELNRYTFRTNIDYKITDKLTIKPKLNFVFDRRDDVREASLYQAYTNLPWDSPYAPDGSVVNAREAEGDSWLGRDRSNFFYDQQWNYTDSRSFDLFASFDFEYKLFPNVTFISTNNFQWGNFESFSYVDPRSNAGLTQNGSVSDTAFRNLRRFTNQMLKYSNVFGEDHTVNMLLAYEYNDGSSKNLDVRSENVIVNGEVQSVGLEPAAADGTRSEFAQQSALFSADYDYKGLYFVKGSLRIDGASAFDDDYRYGEFYSIAAGWNVHRENWFNVDQINSLKLRLSNGAVGNQPGGFGYLNLYDVRFQYAGLIAAKPSQLGTEDLTWEKAIETNAGLDARLFDAISLSVDYYNKENSGLLYFRALSDQTGFSGRFENIGSIVNEGIEVAASIDAVNTSDFGINFGFNASFNNNTIEELADGADIISGSNILREGEEFGTFYMRKWLGVNPDNGEPLYEIVDPDTGERRATNVYNDATVQIVGTSNPTVSGGFNTNFRVKNFSLSSNWTFAYGNELYNSSRNLFDSDGFYLQYNQIVLPDGWSRWEQPGDVATHPKPREGGYEGSNQTSSRYLEDGSYLRLNNVRFNYNFPKTIIDRLGISSANIYLSGDNLVTFTKFTGVDPTIGGAGGFVSIGYPVPKRYALGLNITF